MGHHWTDIWVEMTMSDIGKSLKKYLDQAKNSMKAGSRSQPLWMYMRHHEVHNCHPFSKMVSWLWSQATLCDLYYFSLIALFLF